MMAASSLKCRVLDPFLHTSFLPTQHLQHLFSLGILKDYRVSVSGSLDINILHFIPTVVLQGTSEYFLKYLYRSS